MFWSYQEACALATISKQKWPSPPAPLLDYFEGNLKRVHHLVKGSKKYRLTLSMVNHPLPRGRASSKQKPLSKSEKTAQSTRKPKTKPQTSQKSTKLKQPKKTGYSYLYAEACFEAEYAGNPHPPAPDQIKRIIDMSVVEKHLIFFRKMKSIKK